MVEMISPSIPTPQEKPVIVTEGTTPEMIEFTDLEFVVPETAVIHNTQVDVLDDEKFAFAIPMINSDGNTVKSPTNQQGEFDIQCNTEDIRRDVTGIFTTPRLLFSDNMFCAQNSLYALGITINWSQGVFWGQVMTRLLSESMKKGFKYALVLDYDSLFNLDDVRELYAIMESQPDLSAVCPLQARRGDGSPLATVLDVDGNEALILNRKVFDLTTVPIASGHFGLTMIRLADLRKMAKPWFVATPDSNGEWENGKMDDDIMFWKRMRDAGNKISLAPNIHIGHMELMAVWFDGRLNPLHQPINEYQTQGKPSWSFGRRMVRVQGVPEDQLAGTPPDFNERV